MHVPASIEVSPKQVMASKDLADLFPAGTKVYIADLVTGEPGQMVAAARRLRELGYEPVPHFAARRVTTREALEERLAALAGEAGVRDILAVGGAPGKPVGAFDSALSLLETGLFSRYGIERIGIAGHPEGSPDFSEEVALQALGQKLAYGKQMGVDMRIVTQFGFDAKRFLLWAEDLRLHGIDLPVHIGASGPAQLPTLVKYAVACGVGNSLNFLKKQAGKLTTLMAGYDPETFVGPVETHWRSHPDGIVRQIHVFAFGGLKAASVWLKDRGSWS